MGSGTEMLSLEANARTRDAGHGIDALYYIVRRGEDGDGDGDEDGAVDGAVAAVRSKS